MEDKMLSKLLSNNPHSDNADIADQLTATDVD